MKNLMTALALALFASLGFSPAASAATVNDPTLYSNLDVGSEIALDGFALADAGAGPATLSIRYGQWTGTPGTLSLDFTFNGTLLGPSALSTGAYYSDPASISYDVTGLVVNGLNTLTVFGTLIDGGPTTYAVGEITLDYTDVAAVPLPAALPLLAGAVLLGGFGARRRSRAA